MCFIFVQENDQHLVSVRLPWCFSLSHHRKWPTSFFQPHFISKSEQEKNMFLSIQSWILLGICFGMLSRCCPIRCFYPLTNAPQNGQNPYVCHTLSNLVGFCSYYFASQICFFKPHPTCHFYPKYIQIWFHSCCPIYVCSFCMFSLPFFFWTPTFITGGLRLCRPKQSPRCDAMPSLWHGSERIPRWKFRCGKCTFQLGTLQEWYCQWMRWTITKVTWI